jgi:ubiquinone/menaquinone biosynthesis C-methylase UbiE
VVGMSKEDRFWFGKVRFRVLEGKMGVREAYDCMAGVYDFSEYLYWTRKMEEAEERIIGKWMNGFSGVCLDVGCGTGRYSLRIAENRVDVVALDLSSKMLKRLKAKAKRSDVYDRVDVVVADGERFPFRENVFDCLVCTLAFDHFEDCEGGAGEFSRVLKGDGLCVVSVFNGNTLGDFQKSYGFGDKVPFKTEDMSPVLVFEVGHSAGEVEEIFGNFGFAVDCVKGCCYWHISRLFEVYYPLWLDSFFNLFRGMLNKAEIHGVLMRKRHGL